jgi:hypothetical protein
MALGGSSGGRHDQRWVAMPEHTEEVIRANTGRGWEDWRGLIDAWPGHAEGHGAVAAWLQEEHGVPGWWAQSVTVGWERITGRRLPHQVADGTFTANRSATITVDAALLEMSLRDPDALEELFPGLSLSLRSRPTSKTVRIAFEDGMALIAVYRRDHGRATVHVSHEKLTTPQAVEHWKGFWGRWLSALDGT